MPTYKHMAVVVDYHMNEVRAYASQSHQQYAGWWISGRHLIKTVKGTNRLCRMAAFEHLRRIGPPTFTNINGKTYEQIEDHFRGAF